jgi:muconate cycloisomerase
VTIIKIEVFPVRIPLKKPQESAHGKSKEQDSVVVKITTSNHTYGIGSVEPRPGYDEETPETIVDTLEERLTSLLLGEDPFQIRRITEKMDSALARHAGSKSLVEMALFDLVGKILGVPVHVLLGGRVRDSVYLNGWIGIITPEAAAVAARELLDKGFRSCKVKINNALDDAVKRVEAVRSAVGDRMQIRVDANESLNVDEASQIVRRLAPYGVTYLEQPLPKASVNDFAALGKSSPIDLMADESVKDMETLMTVLKSESIRYVKLKIQKMGGFLKAMQAVHVAAAMGVSVIFGHGWGFTPNTLAEVHMAASSRAIVDGCESVGPLKMADDIVTDPFVMDRGVVAVPCKPGLGADLDEEKLNKYRVR